MKTSFWSIVLVAGTLAITCAALAVQVDGYCYLEGQSNHSGTRVLFEADSPTAETDSAFTDISGHYQADLSPGLYDVGFSHPGYIAVSLNDQFFAVPLTLPDVTLEELPGYPAGVLISGALSGLLADTVYVVESYIWVNQHDTLVVEPGAEFYFLLDGSNAFPFTVYGTLTALGNENDSIKFLRATETQRWNGIIFDGLSGSSSTLEYCLISTSTASGIWCTGSGPTIDHCTIIGNSFVGVGAGIACSSEAYPLISNCIIRDNISSQMGGGIGCQSGASPTIENCQFIGNRAPHGGGIYGVSCDLTISDCTFEENVAYNGDGGAILLTGSDIQSESCSFVGNSAQFGGGVALSVYSHGTIANASFSDNAASVSGGGIYVLDTSDLWISHCLVTNNSAGSNGAGIGCYGSSPEIVNCTISDNTSGYAGGGMMCYQSAVGIRNTIVEGNHGLGGIYFSSAFNVSISFCDFNDNEDGNFAGSPPLYVGVLISTNANGDSCDTYYNIFEDPAFVNPQGGDYHLQPVSPCIDAGDPNSPLDPDGTVADMGAYFFDQLWVNPNPGTMQPTSFRLLPNYPNPFNPTTTLSFVMPHRSAVKLTVYDLLGRQVCTLVDGVRDAGVHRVVFDGSDLSSGVYFCRLSARTPAGQAGDFSAVQKMALLR